MLKRIAHLLLNRCINRQHRFDATYHGRKPWKKLKTARHKRPWYARSPSPPHYRDAYDTYPYDYRRPRGLKAAIIEALLYRLIRR